MPRKPRIHVPGAFYHVTLRGNHRQDIFFCDDDRRLLNDIVAEVIQRTGAKIYAYCWMTNHIHLLAQVGELPLWRTMLRIASRYARTVQRRFRTTGHLFECRYHAVLVDADEYLLTLVRYIHSNPLAAGMVTDLAAYPWSSHHAYLGTREEPWVTTEFVWSMLHRERDRAILQYRRLMSEEPESPRQSFTDELNPADVRILGCDEFVANVHGLAWKPRSRKTVEQLIEEACVTFNLQRDELFSDGRNRNASKGRAWVAHQATMLRIASVTSVAALFKRDESTLRKSVVRYFDLR